MKLFKKKETPKVTPFTKGSYLVMNKKTRKKKRIYFHTREEIEKYIENHKGFKVLGYKPQTSKI